MVQESLSKIEERLSQIDHEIEEYRKCIEALEEEKKNLLNNENAETERIKATEKHKVENISINRTNSAKDKAEFLLDLFYSRRDVYAVRSKNKDNKTAYYPKCRYFWSEVCKKKVLPKN